MSNQNTTTITAEEGLPSDNGPKRSRRWGGRARLVGGIAAGALLLAACGGGGTESQAAEAGAGQAAADAEAGTFEGTTPIDVLSGSTDLGNVLVGPDGRTLYGFTNDVQAASTCYGTCADAWPPVLVSDDWAAGPGLDFGIFATTVRDDGTTQLVAGAWPLYYFAGDAVPGDVNGQGSGNVWFAVDLDGGLITTEAVAAQDGGAETGDADATPAAEAEAAAAIVTESDSDLGPILVDDAGLSLYGFLNDRGTDGSTCNDACADAWPPFLVDGPELPAGLDADVFSVITRADGTNQLQAGNWPLYRFAGDAAPGEINGQGSGDVWFAAAPDGSLIGAGISSSETDDTADAQTEDQSTGTTSDY